MDAQRPRRVRWALSDGHRSVHKSNVGVLLSQLLASRGVTEDALRAWTVRAWHDAYLLYGMQTAVARVREAIARKERILVYGDYDADGVCAVALMVQVLRTLGAMFFVDIPHRMIDGYGLHNRAVHTARTHGCTLIVTVDTGICALEAVAYARSLGIDVIITDHHEVPDVLPEAVAIVNPKQAHCTYPFDALCGVGVAWKLAYALCGEQAYALLPCAAIGTIADMVPLHGENRSIVQGGLDAIQRGALPGVAALLRLSGNDVRDTNAQTISFVVGPRLNAAGRLDRADDAVRLLIAPNMEAAMPFAQKLHVQNEQRRQLVEQAMVEAIAQVQTQRTSAIVVVDERWHPGIIGIVAARLLDKYGVPTVVGTLRNGLVKCSARSVAGVHLMHVLRMCAETIVQYGGHASAAGLTIAVDALPAFTEAFAAAVRVPQVDVHTVIVDGIAKTTDCTVQAVGELAKLAPFGHAHPTPTFVLPRVSITDVRTIGNGAQHMKAVLRDDVGGIEAVQFRYDGSPSVDVLRARPHDVIVEPSIARVRGVARV
ncbi:MAG: single-stranded-DNA-specific exonuclease RecJ, partial [Paenibacillaceae bacterium]|nr:single-stranded-DNA-specific exonuclease RecJ [Paenibacillaceae bacterium]